MQIKCDYCGSYINEKDEFCSQCGAVNANFKRSTDGTPKTISELKVWYNEKNLPPEDVTRFFIGKNYQGPKAFGIYEENGEFIVYKNKADGTRAVRYKGTDEAYAVNELYLKLKSEILNQKAHNINEIKSGNKQVGSNNSLGLKIIKAFYIVFICFVVSGFISAAFFFINGLRDIPYAGNYYVNGDDVYYCESYIDDDWYLFDYDSKDYIPVSIPKEMYDDIQNYKFSDFDEWDENVEMFEDTETGQYVNSLHSSSSDSSDSDYSWDSSDSWDSGSSDWDSDW